MYEIIRWKKPREGAAPRAYLETPDVCEKSHDYVAGLRSHGPLGLGLVPHTTAIRTYIQR